MPEIIDLMSSYKWHQRVDYFALTIGAFYFSQVMASCFSRTVITHLEVRYGVPTEFVGNVSSFYATGALMCYTLLFFVQKFFQKNRPRYIIYFHYISTGEVNFGKLYFTRQVHFFTYFSLDLSANLETFCGCN